MIFDDVSMGFPCLFMHFRRLFMISHRFSLGSSGLSLSSGATRAMDVDYEDDAPEELLLKRLLEGVFHRFFVEIIGRKGLFWMDHILFPIKSPIKNRVGECLLTRRGAPGGAA